MERADIWNDRVCEPSEERAVPVAATLQGWPPGALDDVESDDGHATVKT